MTCEVTKGFHFHGEVFPKGSRVDVSDFPKEIVDWLKGKGCLLEIESAAERKPKRKKGA